MGKGLLQRLGLARPQSISLADFRERTVSEIRRRRPDAVVILVGDLEVEVNDFGKLRVDRGYAYYRQHPRDLEIVIGQLADLALYEREAAKSEELIVLVRPESFTAGAEDSDDRGLARALPGGLIAVVAVDKPEQYIFFTGSELRKDLGADDAAIWARALENLRNRISMKPPAYRSGQLMGLKTDIGLAASLLVLDDYWDRPAFSSYGDWVVAPLERDELVLAPAREPQLVQALRNLVARRDTAEFLCDRLLLRRDGIWSEFE
jgi:hypothetical protein